MEKSCWLFRFKWKTMEKTRLDNVRSGISNSQEIVLTRQNAMLLSPSDAYNDSNVVGTTGPT